MNKQLHATNEEIVSAYFAFHVKDAVSGKSEVSGLENVCVIRCNMKSSNELEELIEFKSFQMIMKTLRNIMCHI